ncbi:MAG TPA: DUF2520 domain-containing protein [Pyrinomonadaceae bacterium]|nr:DUF2520 domain-containing protein [Pyrinomonadaceae bacterium]
MPPEKGKGKGRRGQGENASQRARDVNDESARASRARPSTRSSFPLSPFPLPLVSVAVVGAGRLGTALARALASCGYEVAAVVSRRVASARRAAALVSPRTRHFSAAQLSELPPVNLLLITTPDDRLAETAARLAHEIGKGKGKRVKGKGEGGKGGRLSPIFPLSPLPVPPSPVARVALHASGALSSDVLAPLREVGFAVGSMHPLVSVSEPLSGEESLRRAFYCVEGDAGAVRAARSLAGALGGRSFTINTRDKSLYHAAAVMTSGHTVALFDLATRLLARCGLTPAGARRVLLPLLSSTLENLSAQEPARALTGSFARADLSTVRRHLAALDPQSEDEPADAFDDTSRDALDVYALLGRHSLRLAARADADPRALEQIALALAEILDRR